MAIAAASKNKRNAATLKWDIPKNKKPRVRAPDVILQASSPSTTMEDRREKMELYERFGVAEYFIIDPDAGFIEKYMLKDGKYNGRVGIYAGDTTLHIDTIEFELAAKSLFAFYYSKRIK